MKKLCQIHSLFYFSYPVMELCMYLYKFFFKSNIFVLFFFCKSRFGKTKQNSITCKSSLLILPSSDLYLFLDCGWSRIRTHDDDKLTFITFTRTYICNLYNICYLSFSSSSYWYELWPSRTFENDHFIVNLINNNRFHE